MRISFEGQTALVTGATRGIGKQIADDLERLGARLLLTGTNDEEIGRLNQSCRNDRSLRRWYALDFTQTHSVQAFLREIESCEKIDICINNAGINRINAIDVIQDEDWQNILRVNLDGPFLITRAVSGIMKKNGYGRIVNIGSVFGVISKEKRAAYSASKFGIQGLTVASALDLAPENILVNTVSPGFVSTDLTKRVLGDRGMEEMALKIPLGRFASPEEISRAVIFMASNLNTYITGQNLVVDGGFVNA